MLLGRRAASRHVMKKYYWLGLCQHFWLYQALSTSEIIFYHCFTGEIAVGEVCYYCHEF